MKITRDELLRRAQRVNHPLRGKCPAGANICSRCSTVADLIEQAVKETAEECAALVKNGANIQRELSAKCKASNRWTEKEMSVSESGTEAYLTAANALDFWEYQIRSDFGIAEVKRGDKE